MSRKSDSKEAEKARGPLPKDATAQQIQEELAFLRSKCNSLSFRGHYVECVKTIEDNLALFYRGERWPEQFFSILRLHQKCYPSTNKDQSHGDYILSLLKKNDIPLAFGALLGHRDSEITWSAEHFRDLAVAAESKGELEDALSYADIMIKTEPGNAGAYLIRGRILDAMGRGKEALAMYEEALELNPGNRHALNMLARHYLKENPKKALEWVQKAIEKTPDDAVNYGLLAEIYRALGKDDNALETLETAMKMDPYHADYPYQKAEILYSQGKQVTAIPLYRMALALDGNHVPSLVRMTALSKEVQPDLALSYASKAVNLEPENKTALLDKATLLVKTGNTEAAIRQYRSLLEQDEENADAHAGLGAVYLAAGEPERALQHLEKAVKLIPKEPEPHMNKARTHRKLEQPQPAMAEYKTVTTLDKARADAWGEMGDLALATSPKEALDYYGKALAIQPQNPHFHVAKGEILLGMPGQHAAALESLNLACRYHPGDASLHIRLGKLLEEDGNLASAMEHYKKALNILPEDAETHFLLARLLLETRPDQALVHINDAIAHSVTRGDYYYIKAKAIHALLQDPEAMEALKDALRNGEITGDLTGLADLEDEGLRNALVFIDRAIELDSDNPTFLCFRANIFYQMGQTSKAMAQFERLLKGNPQQHEALYGMACILADKKGEEKRALDYCSKAIACAPAVAEYHVLKADLLARDDDKYQEALEEYTAAIQINNQMWRVLFSKARLLDAHGDLEEAMAEYRRALLIRPDIPEVSMRMGILLAGVQPAAALSYLDHVIKLDPENFQAYAWRGSARLSDGQREGGEEDLDAALLHGGDRPETHFFLAEVLATAFPPRALEHCEKALASEDGKAEYHLLFGNLLLDKGEFAQARAAFTRCISLNGSCHEAKENLAKAAFLQGDADAEELLSAALESRPACPECLYNHALMLEARGDTQEALALAQQAVKLVPDSLPYRELLVELLRKRRVFLRLRVERRRLDKLCEELSRPLAIPEPPPGVLEEPEQASVEIGQTSGEH